MAGIENSIDVPGEGLGEPFYFYVLSEGFFKVRVKNYVF
jgi:hypothetical protein